MRSQLRQVSVKPCRHTSGDPAPPRCDAVNTEHTRTTVAACRARCRERRDICLYRYIISRIMARAATTADAFNAVAEPRRREILDALAGGERPVNDLVALLGLAQPQVSKHLRVLREVGAVDVREDGRRRLYRLNGRSEEHTSEL